MAWSNANLLHATFHNKSFLAQRRYHALLREKTVEEKVTAEDEITSTILGPMDFMQPMDILCIWKAILAKAKKYDEFPLREDPVSANVKLWPNEKINGDKARYQPDASITFNWSDGESRTLLIEAKWDAPLSEDQLQNQWDDFSGRHYDYHILIGKTVNSKNIREQIEKYQRKQGEWSRLVPLTWTSFRRSLIDLSKMEDSGATRYARYAECFLKAAGVSCFLGFKAIKTPGFISSHPYPPIFYRLFCGFTALGHLPKSISQWGDDYLFYDVVSGDEQ